MGHPISLLSSKKFNFFYCNDYSKLESPVFWITLLLSQFRDFYSADLSPKMSSILNRYVYSACCISAITDHPLSKLSNSTRGPGLSRPRSLKAPTSMVGLSRRNDYCLLNFQITWIIFLLFFHQCPGNHQHFGGQFDAHLSTNTLFALATLQQVMIVNSKLGI